MARGAQTFSPNSVRAPARAKPPGLPDLMVDGVEVGDTNIHVDANSGHVITQNPDGSATVAPIGRPAKKPRTRKTFNDNLAEDIDESILATIATRVLDGIDNDIRSRQEWEQTAQKGASLLGVKLEEASTEIGVDGMVSRVKHTGLLQACLASWASSRAELLPVGGPVKVRDDAQTEEEETLEQGAGIGHNGGPALDGADLSNVVPGPGAQQPSAAAPPVPGSPGIDGMPPQMAAALAGGGIGGAPAMPGQQTKMEKRNALADALEHDMNHYLTVIDKDYYPDTSRMLMSRGLLGCQFKKIYRDPLLRRPVSRWVKGTDLIISNEASSLSSAARITERSQQRQSVVKRLQILGHWRDIELVIPTTETSAMDRKIAETEGITLDTPLAADQLHTIYETYTELDECPELKADEKGRIPGFPLPYRVTFDKDSRRILEIRRNWKEGDDTYVARRRYVKFGHVPGLGFYDWGFVHLIGNPQRAATMVEQVLIDTGMFASFPGGVMARSPGTRQRTTEVRPSLGQFITMDTGGLPISDFVMPWPYKEPSAVLAGMGQDLVSQMKQVAGVVELPVGEGRIGNTPVGTIMAYVDAVTKVPSAVHKDDHIAQQEEFELLKELFAEDPKALWRNSRKPARKWEVAQEILDQDLVPASDPNIPSQTHRLMQTNMLVGMSGMPQFAGIANTRAIWETAIRTIGASNTGEYTMPEKPAAAPPPDPKIVTAQIKANSEREKSEAAAANDQRDHSARMEELAVESADKERDRQSEEERARLKAAGEAQDRHADLLKHGAGIAADQAQHGDNLAVRGHELGQDHIHHLNDLEQAHAQSDREAAAVADPTAAPTGEP